MVNFGSEQDGLLSENATRRYRFGLYEANVESGELYKSGSKVRLQEQPFQVLVALLERPGEVVTREEIRLRLWPSDTFVDFDHGLNTAINKLRDALGDGAANPRFIETLPRRGYRFIAPVQAETPMPPLAQPADELQGVPAVESRPVTAFGATPATAVQPSEPTGSAPHLPQASRKVSRTLFGLLQAMYLIFYVAALWRFDEIGDRTDTAWHISGTMLQIILLVTAVIGIALRLYTLNATLFDYPKTGRNFQRLFLAILPLDIVWALSPFLMLHILGVGLAFAACAALVYSPFAQRVLALMTWERSR